MLSAGSVQALPRTRSTKALPRSRSTRLCHAHARPGPATSEKTHLSTQTHTLVCQPELTHMSVRTHTYEPRPAPQPRQKPRRRRQLAAVGIAARTAETTPRRRTVDKPRHTELKKADGSTLLHCLVARAQPRLSPGCAKAQPGHSPGAIYAHARQMLGVGFAQGSAQALPRPFFLPASCDRNSLVAIGTLQL